MHLFCTMLKTLGILWGSFKMALQELRVNKLRTFLSLFGITIGITCIIGVLSAINGFEQKINDDLKSFGTNTIYIDKWEYAGGNDYPWWKYVKRPEAKYDEMLFLSQKSSLAKQISFFASTGANINYGDKVLKSSNIYSITEQHNKIHDLSLGAGRFFSDADFERGTAVAIFGYNYAELLFGEAEKAVGKMVTIGGKAVYVVGILKKQGKSLLGGFDYENSVLTPYRFFAATYNIKYSNPFILVQGKDNVSSAALANELRGAMRQIRRLSPTQEDNFSCNDINELGQQIGSFIGSTKMGGWFIAGLSLLVGGFGVANIMFVTVRERTSQIGLKKAIGAKKTTILLEFLLESAFLCIIGGLLGLFFVWLITVLASAALPFSIGIPTKIIILAFSICITLGVLAGIIPASIAAKMDAVVAIRTK